MLISIVASVFSMPFLLSTVARADDISDQAAARRIDVPLVFFVSEMDMKEIVFCYAVQRTTYNAPHKYKTLMARIYLYRHSVFV